MQSIDRIIIIHNMESPERGRRNTMLYAIALVLTVIAATVAEEAQQAAAKPGEGYERGNVLVMKLLSYPNLPRARNADTDENSLERDDKIAKPFSRLLVLESVKDKDDNNAQDYVDSNVPVEEGTPIYVKKLSETAPEQHVRTKTNAHQSMNRQKRSLHKLFGGGGGGGGGGYGGGYSNGGYGNGGYSNGGYGNGGNHGSGLPSGTNIIIVPISSGGGGRYPQGGHGGGGHHGGGNYGNGGEHGSHHGSNGGGGGGHYGGGNGNSGGGGYYPQPQPIYSSGPSCGGRGCGGGSYYPNPPSGGCQGNCGGGGHGSGGSFSQATASASSGSWSAK